MTKENATIRYRLVYKCLPQASQYQSRLEEVSGEEEENNKLPSIATISTAQTLKYCCPMHRPRRTERMGLWDNKQTDIQLSGSYQHDDVLMSAVYVEQ